MIQSVEVPQAEEIRNPHGFEARRLHTSKHAEMIHIRLKPGQGLPRHVTPVDVCFYGLEGEGVVEIGDEEAPLRRDMLIESPAGIPHRIRNDGSRPVRVLVVKTPRPTAEPTKEPLS